MQGLNPTQLAKYIDQTLLKADATEKMVLQLCKEAIENSFYAICVNSCFVPFAKKNLVSSSVKIASVVGFPLGAMSSVSKADEARWCALNGADEIDMVLQVGYLKEKNFDYVESDIAAVVEACKLPVKVILETALLNQEEKIAACELSKSAGAAFVKTCTGFGGGGATIEDIQLMRKTVGPEIGVKASGGIKSFEFAAQLIAAGANRIGTSSGVQLVKGVSTGGAY